MTATFGVHHEWGRLREVVVGAEPALAEWLEREAVTTHIEPLASPRDPLIVIGRHLIEASLRLETRQQERFTLRPIVQRHVREHRAIWCCVPPGRPNGVDGPFLEGGDVLLNGRQVYVGMSGRASDMAGIDWLESLLGDTYRVVPVAMRSSVLHLQDVLALVRPGLLVCCPSLLIDGLPTALRDWQAITISDAEAARSAAHLLVLDAGRLIVAKGNERIAEELARYGDETIMLPVASALRSAHQPLWRESVAE